jgi:polyisoprenoid-binding protein YceI
MNKILICVFAAAWLLTGSAWAEWTLIPSKSHLSFVSVKKEHVAETHTFKHIEGSVSDTGEGELIIDLNSVDTKIPIRDERMEESLFETKAYPTAIFEVSIDAMQFGLINHMEVGDQQEIPLLGRLNLHGVSQELTADAIVTRAGPNHMQVSSAAPVIVRAEDFNLVAGINKLRKIAGLNSISYAVPVTFTLTFQIETPG